MVALEHLFLVNTRLITMPFWQSLAFEEVTKSVTEAAIVVVLNIQYCFLFDRKSGREFQLRPSRGAYFIIFKVKCKTLTSQRPGCRE